MLLIYIDRVCERHRSFTISSLTVHRFIITGIAVASKALCDSYCTNTFYARIGGINTKELNMLELEFLFLIDWSLAATVEGLQHYYENLVKQHPNYIRSGSVTLTKAIGDNLDHQHSDRGGTGFGPPPDGVEWVD